MLIDRVYLPVVTLGPGERIAVWCVGCTKHCPGCANPELWRADPSKRIDDDRLADALISMGRTSGIRRITFSGGDPFEQPAHLARVLRRIRPHFDDILVYTGYTLEELRQLIREEREEPGGTRGFADALSLTDVLIDGRYVAALNDGRCALRGSTNQRVHVFEDGLRGEYERALREPRRIQNVRFGDTSMSIGIHGTPAAVS